MAHYLYSITMKTLIGERYGELMLECLQGTCSGFMTLLGTRHSIMGEIQPNGKGQFSGMLQTLIRKHPFTIEGSFLPERVEARMLCENKAYRLHGQRKEG